MIEGRLAEAHEPKNVLVDVIESAPDERTIKLRDEGGVILEATASEEEEENSGGACGAREEPTLREKDLITELEAVRNRTRELEAELDRVIKDHQHSEELLTEEVSRLCSKVREEKDKNGMLWRLHCAQFADYHDTIVCKDEEIHALRTRVRTLEGQMGREHPARAVHGTTPEIVGHIGEGATGEAVAPESDPGRSPTHPSLSALPGAESETRMLHAISSPRSVTRSGIAAARSREATGPDGRVRSTQTLVIHQWAGPSVIAKLPPDSTPDRAE